MTADPHGSTRPPFAVFFPQEGSSGGRDLEVRTPSAAIGQGPRNDVVLDDDTVSTNHARLEFADGGWRLTDLESRNGTFVDGVRLAPGVPTPLPDQASVAFGAMKLAFSGREGAEPEEVLAGLAAPADAPSLASRAGFRLPLWLALLVLLVLATLAFLFFYFGGGPPAAEPVPEPATALLALAEPARAA
jgi:hypothetical protein